MNLNEANGHVGGGGLDGMNSGEGGLETIQEDQEPDNDQEAIEVCILVLVFDASCIPYTCMIVYTTIIYLTLCVQYLHESG